MIGDIALVLAAAVGFGLALQRLGQSAIVGYLLAGLLIGPGGLGLIEHRDTLEGISELGIALLLFTIGLELPWERLRRFGGSALVAGLGQLLVTLAAAALAAVLLGLPVPGAVAVGMIVSLSSTAVVLRVLGERAQIDSVHAMAALGILLVQDVALVPFLLLLPELDGGSVAAALTDLALSVGKVGLVIVGMYLIDRLVVRPAFLRVAVGVERELLSIMSVLIALAASWCTHAMGLSPALGAFVAGVFIGAAPYAEQVRAEIAPIHVGLVALFFVSVGTLADASYMAAHWWQILVLTLAIIIGKGGIAAGAVRAARFALPPAVVAGLAVAQIGEFSFVLARNAHDEHLISGDLFQLIVSGSLVTLLLTPYVIAGAQRLAERIPHGPTTLVTDRRSRTGGHVVIVGFGPAGQAVAERMRAAATPVTVIEMNPRVSDANTPDGIRTVFGDASRPQVLEAAQVSTCALVVVTIPDPAAARAIISQIRTLAPETPIVARARYHRFLDDLRSSGATEWVDEESETGRLLADRAARLFPTS